MAYGFDEKSITLKNYDKFCEVFMRRMQPFCDQGVSVMLHGSYINGRCIPGSSDIDAVIIVPGKIMTDKDLIYEMGKAYANAQMHNNIPFEYKIHDTVSIADPTMSTYGPEWSDYWSQAKIAGPDYTGEFAYSDIDSRHFSRLLMNMHKVRQFVFEAADNRRTNKGIVQQADNIMRALEKCESAPKKVYFEITGEIYFEKCSSIEAVIDLCADYIDDSEEFAKPYRLASMLRRNEQARLAYMHDHCEGTRLLANLANGVEQIVDLYHRIVPLHS